MIELRQNWPNDISLGSDDYNCIQGVIEVSQQAEWQIREVNGGDMLGGLRVPPVEFSYKSLHF